MKKNVSMNDIVPLIEETIKNQGKFRLYIKGVSMTPLLRNGKDSVVLQKCENINAGDIILYKRNNGAYVLHRVMDIKDSLTLCGDNQHYFEYNVELKDVIAKATSVYRKERLLKKEPKDMKIYLKFVCLRRKFKVLKRLIQKKFCN